MAEFTPVNSPAKAEAEPKVKPEQVDEVAPKVEDTSESETVIKTEEPVEEASEASNGANVRPLTKSHTYPKLISLRSARRPLPRRLLPRASADAKLLPITTETKERPTMTARQPRRSVRLQKSLRDLRSDNEPFQLLTTTPVPRTRCFSA